MAAILITFLKFYLVFSTLTSGLVLIIAWKELKN